MRMLLLGCLLALSAGLQAGVEAHRYDIVPPAEAALEQAGQGDVEGARAALKAAVAADAMDAEAWSALGLLQERLGDRAGARRSALRLAGLLEPRQRQAVQTRQRRYLVELDQERLASLAPEDEPGFTISQQAPMDRDPVKRPTKWDLHGLPTPTPRPTPTPSPTPLRLPSLPRPGAQAPRIHPALR